MTCQSPPEKRWLNGLGYRTQPKFFRAIKKYGWKNFSHDILWQGESVEDAERYEKEFISTYHSCDNKFGYNVNAGGFYNTSTDEFREKVKVAHNTPEYLEKQRKINEKRWANPEEHKKMSERMSGKNNYWYGRKRGKEWSDISKAIFAPYTEKLKRPVICIETGERFESVTDVANSIGVCPSEIRQYCKRYRTAKHKWSGRLHWKYADDFDETDYGQLKFDI